MGSVAEVGGEAEFDAGERIFVAVGKNVEKSKKTLLWVVESFAGKRICVLHVHRPTHVLALTSGKLARRNLKQNTMEAFRKLERQRINELLDEYLLLLDQAGIHADKICIEMDNVEQGIVEAIHRYNIRWLVMGAAADKYYSEELLELKSKKAIFVSREAPVSCNIQFSCNGYLIYTRVSRDSNSETDTVPQYLQRDLKARAKQSKSAVCSLRFHDDGNSVDVLERKLSYGSRSSEHPSWTSNGVVGASGSIPLSRNEEEEYQGQVSDEGDQRLELAMEDVRYSKQKVFEEVKNRWKEEDVALEAKCKATALERLCVKEMSQRKEMEDLLVREKEEMLKTKNQCDEFMKELQMAKGKKEVLENRIAESQSTVEELEEKIISAVELLISFRKQRDEMRVEHGNAIKELEDLRKLVRGDTASFCGTEILDFSFMEINDATNNFDPSLRFGGGKYGSLYKGILQHLQVVIKMLPSYGSQSLVEFQNEVEVLSRVRHPNLVTLIGICSESRSLVYEYLSHGSLEDRLACRKNSPPLTWEIRLRIASEICLALIFLHTNTPRIPHGNIKPSNVLLDANLVCKLSDFGIYRLISKAEETTTTYGSVHLDPEYLRTGRVTPESDVYSFGMILLQLLSGRPVMGVLNDVKCALENGQFEMVLDSTAGDWPDVQAEILMHLALRCCETNPLYRPDLASEIWTVLEPMSHLSDSSASSLTTKEPRRIPSHFVCPIFQEVMKDPHIAADGFTYEADAIRGWFKSGHDTSPMTNLKLPHCNLVPNHALLQAIQEWRQQW